MAEPTDRTPPGEGGGDRRRVFDLGETPEREGGPPTREPEAPTPEEVIRLFREAVDRLIKVARVSPSLAPIIGKFLKEVGTAFRGKGAKRQPEPRREEVRPPVREGL